VETPLFRSADVDALQTVPGVDWDEVRAVRPGGPSPLLQHVGPGRARARIVRDFAAHLGRAGAIQVHARYRAATGRWLLDWAPDTTGHPTRDAAEQLLENHPASEFTSCITLLTTSGHATHTAARLARPGTACVVDCETTALDGSVIEIAVRDAATGELLLDTLLTPPDGMRITPGAEAVHGISPSMLTGAPTLDKIWDRLAELTAGRVLLAYNASFDAGRLRHDADLLGLPACHLTRPASWQCLMELRSAWAGTTTWMRLGTAHHRPEDGPPHRAAADAGAAVRLLRSLTAPPAWWS
jgi:DNA polymerase III epsilon subunit-like protein